jgi:putative acetyltransferase
MKQIVRQETKADQRAVFEVNQQAFGREGEAKLVDALRKNAEVFIPELSLVAVSDEQVVGHILFTRLQIQDGNKHRESLALAPMAVRPAFQGLGVGGQLIQKGLEVAKELGFRSVIVLGHEHYYPKFGFTPAERWGVKSPFEVPAEVFMAIELVPDGLKDSSGLVVYPREFESV